MIRAAVNDLVMLRLPNIENETGQKQTHYNTWFRVMFIDNDNTFIGKVELVDRWEFDRYKIGDHVQQDLDKIQHIYKDGEQFCYSDKIQICECTGLCRDK